jgi:hypothetical protein
VCKRRIQLQHGFCKFSENAVPNAKPLCSQLTLEIENLCITKVAAMATSDALWECIPFGRRTFQFRADSFKMLSRICCLVEWYMRRPHRAFPTKLFLLVECDDDDVIIAVKRDANVCDDLLDALTKQYKQLYPDLSGDEFDGKLYARAVQARNGVWPVEAGHAQLRRMLMRKVQTHQMDVKDLSTYWVARQLDGGQRFFDPTSADRKNSSKTRRVKKTLKKPLRGRVSSRDKRRPNRFNAFNRAMTLRSVGLPNASIVSRAYHQALAGEAFIDVLEKADEMHAIAIADWDRRNRKHRFRFGLPSQEVSRRQVIASRMAVAQRLRALPPEDRALQLANVASRSSDSDYLRAARMQRMVQHGCDVKAKADLLKVQAQFAKDAGKQRLEKLEGSGMLPKGLFRPVPSSDLVHVFEIRPIRPPDAAMMCAKIYANKSADSVNAVIDENWDRAHTRVAGNPTLQAALKRASGGPSESECYRAGFCVCKGDGVLLLSLRNSFFIRMKAIFRPKTAFRALLVGSCIVARVSGTRDDDDQNVDSLWLHIGFLLQNPYRPVYHQLAEVANPGEALGNHRQYLRPLWEILEDFRAMHLIAVRGVTWSVDWYQLESSELVVGRICPDLISVVRLKPGVEPTQFWPRHRAKRVSAAGAKCAKGASASPCSGADSGAVVASSTGEPLAPLPGSAGDDGDLVEAAAGVDHFDDEGEESGGLEGAAALVDVVWDDFFQHVGFDGDGGDLDAPVDAAGSDGLSGPSGAPSTTSVGGVGAAGLPGGSGSGEGGGHDGGPPAPPDPPPPPEPPAKRLRGMGPPRVVIGADCRLEVRGGVISYYSSKNTFEAKCNNPAHGSCVLSRKGSSASSSSTASIKGGRPLGILMAWLSVNDCATKEEHWQRENLYRPLLERQFERYEAMCMPGGLELAAFERDKLPGEDSEPEDLTGY